MIQRVSHMTIYVLDQEEAKTFYTEKLGMDLKMDVTMDNGFRWLTVSPKGQSDLEIVLMGTKPGPMLSEEDSEMIRTLVKNGKMGTGVFESADCLETFQELKAKGVQFSKEPTKEFYGTEALMEDNSGNWFSLTSH